MSETRAIETDFAGGTYLQELPGGMYVYEYGMNPASVDFLYIMGLNLGQKENEIQFVWCQPIIYYLYYILLNITLINEIWAHFMSLKGN